MRRIVLLCAIGALLFTGCKKVDRLPGGWLAVAPEKLPEAGITQWTLYRTNGVTRERVDDLVARYRVYGDCIAYEKINVHDEYRAACGSARTVVVAREQGEWDFDAAGLTQKGRLVTRGVKVFQEERTIRAEALQEATRQRSGPAAVTVTLRPIEPETVLPGGDTPLVVAVLGRDTEAARALIEGGADPNQPGEGNRYPIVLAAVTGNVDLSRLLLDAGSRLDVMTSGVGPLTAAVDRNHLDVVRLLVSSGRVAQADLAMARSHARNRPDILELLAARSDKPL